MTLHCQEFELFPYGLTSIFLECYGESFRLSMVGPQRELFDMDKGSPPQFSPFKNQRRIETQIHRRRKAKALSPLEPEWDISEQAPPARLRMPRPPSPPSSRRTEE